MCVPLFGPYFIVVDAGRGRKGAILGKRREPRVQARLQVRIAGIDASGRALLQMVPTRNISRQGALLAGIQGKLKLGEIIAITYKNSKARFRVTWMGDARHRGSGSNWCPESGARKVHLGYNNFATNDCRYVRTPGAIEHERSLTVIKVPKIYAAISAEPDFARAGTTAERRSGDRGGNGQCLPGLCRVWEWLR